MKMKKIVSLLMVSALSLSVFTGCGSGTTDSTDNAQSSGNQAEAPTQAEEPANTEAPTQAEEPASDTQSSGEKQYDGVELTMWSMWTSSEPQALVIQEAAQEKCLYVFDTEAISSPACFHPTVS